MKKKILTLLILGVTSLGLIGCTGATTETPTKVDSKTTTDQSNAPQTFKIGDTIQLKNFNVTVNGVRSLAQDSKGFTKASEGKEFFLVDCTVENISDKEQSISSMLMFKVVDKEGQSYNQSIFTEANGQLDGSVAPTRKIKGEYCVEVPTGKTGLELVFDSTFLSGGQVIVELR